MGCRMIPTPNLLADPSRPIAIILVEIELRAEKRNDGVEAWAVFSEMSGGGPAANLGPSFWDPAQIRYSVTMQPYGSSTPFFLITTSTTI